MVPKKRRREVGEGEDEEVGGGDGREVGEAAVTGEEGRANDDEEGRANDDEEGRANDDKDPEVVDGGDISEGDADDIDDRSQEKQQLLAKLGMMLASYMVQIPDNTYSRQIKSKLESLLCDVKLMESWIEVNDPESSSPGSVREILEQWGELKDTVKNITGMRVCELSRFLNRS
jgi:hypothetical protein